MTPAGKLESFITRRALPEALVKTFEEIIDRQTKIQSAIDVFYNSGDMSIEVPSFFFTSDFFVGREFFSEFFGRKGF